MGAVEVRLRPEAGPAELEAAVECMVGGSEGKVVAAGQLAVGQLVAAAEQLRVVA